MTYNANILRSRKRNNVLVSDQLVQNTPVIIIGRVPLIFKTYFVHHDNRALAHHGP